MKTTTIEGEDVAAAVETEDGGQTKRNSQVVDKQSDMSLQNVQGDYQEKNRLVNLKKDKELRFDPHMPFQNVQLKNDYYIVPTQNFDWDKTNQTMSKLQDKPKVSLEIQRIPNPTTQPRQPVKPVAISMSHVDVAKVNNPNDKNTTVNLTEKQK